MIFAGGGGGIPAAGITYVAHKCDELFLILTPVGRGEAIAPLPPLYASGVNHYFDNGGKLLEVMH